MPVSDDAVADLYTQRKRREIMRAVRTKNTAPERIAEDLLAELNLTFDRHPKELPGTPDFYLPKQGVAVFVHGCFWHGHSGCLKGTTLPKTNRRFWKAKIEENTRRDRRTAGKLRAMGLSVYTVWECELKRGELPARLVRRLSAK